MKIVCDACQAKYSISDDKVQGKVFKIRCKKCSNIIVVRGGAGGAAEPAPEPAVKSTRVYDYGDDGGGAPADDAVWHLVINQDQVGPMTAAEVQQRFGAGEIDSETFAWREGFADWLPLSQVDAFASLSSSGGGAYASGGGGGAQAVSAMFGGGDDLGGTSRSDPGDLFAAASGGRADDGDLFGGKPAAAPAANAQKLRGERNESSVLFSLNNLAQLASNSPPPAAASSSSSAGHATGAAGGEGSGLIDIRSMASAYLGGAGAAARPAAQTAGVGSIDDLPVFGGVGFSEPAVLVPTARASNNNKILYAMIGAVGLLAIAAVIMVVMLLKSKPPAAVASTAPAPSEKSDDKASGKADTAADTGSGSANAAAAAAAGSAAAGSGSGSDTGSAAAGSGSGGSATQVAANTPPPPTAPAHHDTPKAAPTSTHSVSGTAPSHSTRSDSPPPAPKADKTVASSGSTSSSSGGGGGGDSGGCDEVSCVLNNYEGACCAKFKHGGGGGGGNKAPSSGGGGGGGSTSSSGGGGGGGGNSSLPASLDRDSIQAGISSVKGKANSCGDKSSAKGIVLVHVKVAGDGHVSDVSVEKTPDQALSACVAAAIKRGSFAKTQSGGSFRIPFTF